MANSEFKNTAQSTLRDTQKMGEKMGERMDSLKDSADRFASDASPRVKEALNQVSDVAGDLYDRASSWLGEEDNRKYGFIALVAAVGIFGFFMGRNFRSESSEF
jgi:ElaB/YqjD/DUF883 family membrane-anchored ribosome-binding protein